MTEEMIVNGVDVSGCGFLNKTNGFKHCYCMNAKDTLGDERNTRYGGCEYNENCYYKQLKRLEFENKKLKEELAEANQLKDMYHTYYRAKHDDIKGIIFKQKEKLEKIKEYANQLEIYTHIKEDLLNIIGGTEDE